MAPNLTQYLDRIGYIDKPEISLECLLALQSCHQLTVPFENLDIFMGRKKVLNIDILFDKIVKERRGGWCHELNGLFSWLLKEIGFNVKIISCRYYDRNTQTFRPDPFDHMAIIVEICSIQYLVDVGYGFPNQHFKPLEISTEKTYIQAGGSYRFLHQRDEWLLQHKSKVIQGGQNNLQIRNIEQIPGIWYTMHKFQTTLCRRLEEFQPCCTKYEMENPRLSRIPVCIIKSEDGRVIKVISGTTFTTINSKENEDNKTIKLNMDDVELNKILFSDFEIFLTRPLKFNFVMQEFDKEK